MTEKTTITRHTRRFPEVLFEMLEEVGRHAELKNVVSWLPCGTGFQIHIRSIFINIVLPLFFKNSKYKSFNRQLNLYKFQRCTVGNRRRARGAYAHPKFRRDRPDLLVELKRDPPNVKEDTTGRYSSYMDRRSKLFDECHIDHPSLNTATGGGGLLLSSSTTTTTNGMMIASSSGTKQVNGTGVARRSRNMSRALYFSLLSSWALTWKQEYMSSTSQQQFLHSHQQQCCRSPPTEQDIVNEIIRTFGNNE